MLLYNGVYRIARCRRRSADRCVLHISSAPRDRTSESIQGNPGMDDEKKSKGQLIAELRALRQRVAALAAVEIERKRAEAALRNGQERLRLVLQTVHVGVWDWDIRTGVVTWSEQVEQIFGLPPGGFAGTYEAYLAVVHPADRQAVVRAISAAIAGQASDYSVEHRILWPDGSVRWLECKGHVCQDHTGQPLSLAGMVVDITPRKESDVTLQESEARCC